ncbi:hypothetical protein [Psychromonas sp. SP041]|uniref:hypothetical protein n=1 Tax=Psychromonas sp. SP041 TaxID=1365007 RepID=UPI0004700048|nr:hypothetical protein [Psychromonas sp. SP041]
MIPMGSVVTACMIVGLIVALPPIAKGCPKPIRLSIGTILLAAGLWNILWYASQHITEFWGVAAFCSGVLMLITSTYIIKVSWLPLFLQRAKPVVLLMLLGFAALYATKIYSL